MRVEPAVWLWGAVLLIMVPLPWLAAAALAVCVHELCHYVAVRAAGGRVFRLRIGIGGMVMERDRLTSLQELCCALAGPAGSLVLVCLYRWIPRTALCGLVQGAFNLLPVYPLDGGRVLRVLAGLCCSKRADPVCEWVERTCLLLLVSLAGYLSIRYSMGILPILMGIYLLFRLMERKIPCKPGRLGVQ